MTNRRKQTDSERVASIEFTRDELEALLALTDGAEGVHERRARSKLAVALEDICAQAIRL